MVTQIENQRETVLDRQSSKTAPPPMYQVVLLNDDYTPMEFVVVVLQRIFVKTKMIGGGYYAEGSQRGQGCMRACTRAIFAPHELKW